MEADDDDGSDAQIHNSSPSTNSCRIHPRVIWSQNIAAHAFVRDTT
jgi:hypothetical protein